MSRLIIGSSNFALSHKLCVCSYPSNSELFNLSMFICIDHFISIILVNCVLSNGWILALNFWDVSSLHVLNRKTLVHNFFIPNNPWKKCMLNFFRGPWNWSYWILVCHQFFFIRDSCKREGYKVVQLVLSHLIEG